MKSCKALLTFFLILLCILEAKSKSSSTSRGSSSSRTASQSSRTSSSSSSGSTSGTSRTSSGLSSSTSRTSGGSSSSSPSSGSSSSSGTRTSSTGGLAAGGTNSNSYSSGYSSSGSSSSSSRNTGIYTSNAGLSRAYYPSATSGRQTSDFKSALLGAATGILTYQAGRHIIRSVTRPFLWSGRSYYWDRDYYEPPSRTKVIMCYVPINASDPVLGDIYLEDGVTRPKEIVWSCLENEYCCGMDCCVTGGSA